MTEAKNEREKMKIMAKKIEFFEAFQHGGKHGKQEHEINLEIIKMPKMKVNIADHPTKVTDQ